MRSIHEWVLRDRGVDVGGRVVSVGDVLDLDSLQVCDHLWGLILRYCVEVSIDQTVRVSLPRLTHEANVSEASIQQHLPDVRVSPVVSPSLRPNFDIEVVVFSFQSGVDWRVTIHRNAYDVLAELFERVVESAFVIFTFTLAIADEPVRVTDKEQDTPVVYAVETGHIGDRITVNEDEGEVRGAEYFVFATLKEAFGPCPRDMLVTVDGGRVEVHRLRSVTTDLVFLLKRPLLHQGEVVLHLLPATELLKHHHFILAVIL